MSVAKYFNLNIPAPKRLAMLRADFESHAAQYPYCPEHAKPKSWRDLRGATHKSLAAYGIQGLHQGQNDGGVSWYSHSGPNFRMEQAVHAWDDVRIDHTGWYSDADYGEKVVGIVGLLPHGRFIAGYYWSSNGERVYYPEVFDSVRDAAHAADEHARVYAENCREDDERQREYRRVEESIEDNTRRLRECLVLLRHKPCMQYVREEIENLIEKIRNAREMLATDLKEYA